jgi:hypothetical protein
MNALRRLFNRAHRVDRANGVSNFDRYYGRVIGQGAGYPTADEARRDMTSQRDLAIPFGWPR